MSTKIQGHHPSTPAAAAKASSKVVKDYEIELRADQSQLLSTAMSKAYASMQVRPAPEPTELKWEKDTYRLLTPVGNPLQSVVLTDGKFAGRACLIDPTKNEFWLNATYSGSAYGPYKCPASFKMQEVAIHERAVDPGHTALTHKASAALLEACFLQAGSTKPNAELTRTGARFLNGRRSEGFEVERRAVERNDKAYELTISYAYVDNKTHTVCLQDGLVGGKIYGPFKMPKGFAFEKAPTKPAMHSARPYGV